MDNHIPSGDEVRALLAPLSMKDIEALAVKSGVPAPTIYKIKLGTTTNPGIETLRKFIAHIPAVAN